MAERLGELAKGVEAVLGERKKLEKTEKKLIRSLSRVLGKLGYQVVAAKGRGRRRRRRARRRVRAVQRRGRGIKKG